MESCCIQLPFTCSFLFTHKCVTPAFLLLVFGTENCMVSWFCLSYIFLKNCYVPAQQLCLCIHFNKLHLHLFLLYKIQQGFVSAFMVTLKGIQKRAIWFTVTIQFIVSFELWWQGDGGPAQAPPPPFQVKWKRWEKDKALPGRCLDLLCLCRACCICLIRSSLS